MSDTSRSDAGTPRVRSEAEFPRLRPDCIEETVYDWESFRHRPSPYRHVPVLEAGPGSLTIDGTFAGWEGCAGFRLPSFPSQVVMDGWKGEGDLSADIRFAYDSGHLYWAARVRDDVHVPVEGSDMWRGDSIQIAFSENGVYGPDFGFNCASDGARVAQWKQGSGTSGPEAIESRTTRTGDETVYTVKMPWKAIFSGPPPEGSMTFALLINDNDGGRRRGWIEWTPGFGREKDPGRHGRLHLIPALDPWTVWTEGPEEAQPGVPTAYTLVVPNISDRPASYRLESGLLGLVRDLTVPARSVLAMRFELEPVEPGTYTLDFRLTAAGGASRRAASTIEVPHRPEALLDRLDAAGSKLPELERLLAACEAKGIAVDYERIHAAVIRDFVPYGKDDVRHGRLRRARYVAEQLEKLHGEACRSLSDYLSGAKIAKAVPRYATGRPAIDGCAFVGRTVTRSTGTETVQPIFFNGYGHFGQVRADMPKFQDLGANIVQIEIGPRSVIVEKEQGGDPGGRSDSPDDDYGISTAEIEADIVRVLAQAERHDVAVNLLLSPHYFPDWALRKWPELASICSHSLLYKIDHPIARRIVGEFLRTIIPQVKDFRSLHSVTLTNEPVYQTNKDPYYLPAWHRYLQRLYEGRIAELNRIYGTSYASFEEVPMPPGVGAAPISYDWIVFNQELFAEWHRWMAGIIRSIAPDLPVHAKIMGDPQGSLGWGIDIEAFSAFSQINGNDNWNYLGEGARGFAKEMSFYDLQVSMKPAPVFNSEHHIIPDGDQRYVPGHAEHVRAMLWQGPLHGKSATTIWVWERTYDTTDDKEGSVLHRPDVVAAIGRTNHDLNRLAREVTAFQNAETRVAILYAVPSSVYSTAYPAACLNAYEAVSFSGVKVGFLSERQVAQGMAERYDFVIVPAATHVLPETLSGLCAYVEKGAGTVVVIGDGTLRKDQHDRPLPDEQRSALFGRAVVLPSDSPTAPHIRDRLLPQLASAGLCGTMLVEAETGRPVYGVEWRTAVWQGRRLLSAVNDTETAISVVILDRGRPAVPEAELIEGTAPESEMALLQPLTPYMFDLGPVGRDD
ncbi:sugar-binding protein [Paenibacillus flagellatus]|nr:sugar-binding protein [Paenibacillus flagellatus]